MTKIKIEIVCGNIESAITAQQAGADRVELCDNLAEGGTTPSHGMIKVARKKLSIGLYIMIRPRGGDFLYSDDEVEIMKCDIEVCRQLKVDGVVLGLLKEDGTVDKVRTKELVEFAKPMSVTFHRAFDMTKNPEKALEDIIACGCDRILTSGQQPTAIDGADMIARLVKFAKGRIVILPGGGIRPGNVASLIAKTGVYEVHSSAKVSRSSLMKYKNDVVRMGLATQDEQEVSIVSVDMVRELKNTANGL